MGKLKERIIESQFDFSFRNRWFAFWTCPFYFVRKNLYVNIKRLAPRLSGSIMDFGCGAKPYKNLFSKCTSYIGVDIETSGHDHTGEKIDVFYDGKTLPFDDESFDNIFSSEVYEHVENIDEIIGELHRVLKPNGLMLLSAPFVWNEHEIPYDFHRFTSFGIAKLLEKNGFEVVDSSKSTSYIEIIYQMKAEYYRNLFKNVRSSLLKWFLQITLISFQTLKGIIIGSILPKRWSFYGDNVVLCRKIAK